MEENRSSNQTDWNEWFDELAAAQRSDAFNLEIVDFMDDRLQPQSRALELGAGTGEVAALLAERGHEVVALDISDAAVEIIKRQTPAAGSLVPLLGDMLNIDETLGRFNLIYATNSVIYALLTQEEQTKLFKAMSSLLATSGVVVLHTFQATAAFISPRRQLNPHPFPKSGVHLSVSDVDPISQRVSFRELRLDNDRVKVSTIEERYIVPSEMDLMARMAGLERVERVGYPGMGPMHHRHGSYVTVYQGKA